MTHPIGGAFELDLDTVLGSATKVVRLPGTAVTSGRTALALLVRWLRNRGARGPVAVPAYLCGSVIQGIRAGGADVRFYPVGRDLRVGVDSLERLVSDTEPAAVLVIDYFGFPPESGEAQRLRGLRPVCTIVEDCSHGSLLELPDAAAGTIGDVALTSFRKYLPLPDGGVLLGVPDNDLPPLAPADGTSVRSRLLGQFLRGAYLRGEVGSWGEDTFLDLLQRAEAFLDDELPFAGMSEVSRRLLSRLDLAGCAARRRANFQALLAALTDNDGALGIEPVVSKLPPGVSPLILPVRVADGRRDALRSALVRRGVFCPVHWRLPAEVDPLEFPEEHELAAAILGLPIDQRYDDADMLRLAKEIVAACAESG